MNLYNAKASHEEFLHLYLDISPKNDLIQDFFYDGPKASSYKEELDELKALVINQSIHDCKFLTRSILTREHKNTHFQKSISALSLTLLKEAIALYLGENKTFKEESDFLCLCFGVTKCEIVKATLGSKDFELKTLIQSTRATSACGSCRGQIEELIKNTRLAHGLIPGMDNSRSRVNAKGEWIKILDLYPGPLLLKLDALKTDWMKREGIEAGFEIEFTKIEGHHLDLKIKAIDEGRLLDDKQMTGLAQALSDYLKSKTSVLFFLHTL